MFNAEVYTRNTEKNILAQIKFCKKKKKYGKINPSVTIRHKT